MNRARVAVSIMPLENRRETLLSLATAADRLGYDGYFLPETWAYDTMVLLAEMAVKTQRIALGTGIIGVWNRSAATIAMAASTLASVSGGRFVLGLGASTPQLAEGLHDVAFTAPIARMRRTLGQVRALLRGERIPLAWLAGELADGWSPFLYPRSCLAQGVERLREGAARKFVGAVPDDAEALLEELIVFGTPAEARRRLARWHEAGAALPVLLLRPNLSAEELDFTLDALRPRDAAVRA